MANLLSPGYKGKLLDDSSSSTLQFLASPQAINIQAEDKEIIRQALTVITNAVNTYVRDANTRSYITLILGVVSQILLK
jgi:hypothetical protein